jgi:hypothetical protein
MGLDDLARTQSYVLDNPAGQVFQLLACRFYRAAEALNFPLDVCDTDPVLAYVKLVPLNQVTAANRNAAGNPVSGERQRHGAAPGRLASVLSGLLMFTEAVLEQRGQSVNGLPLVRAIRLEHEFRADRGRQGQHTHDRLGVHGSRSARDFYVSHETGCAIDQARGGPGVQAQFIYDCDIR